MVGVFSRTILGFFHTTTFNSSKVRVGMQTSAFTVSVHMQKVLKGLIHSREESSKFRRRPCLRNN